MHTDMISRHSPVLQAGNTALTLAAEHGHHKIASLLLQHKAQVDATDARGRTALLIGGMKGHSELVGVLVKMKANVNHVDHDGNLLLRTAVTNGYRYLVARPRYCRSIRTLIACDSAAP